MIRPHRTLSLLTAACLYGLLAVSCSPTVDYGYAPQTLRALNIVKDACNYINTLSEIFQNFSCIFRRILKGNQLKLDFRTELVNLRP